MPNYSLIFARSLQHADDSAIIDWHWQRSDELHSEYRRPDTGERARFVPDLPGTLQGLRFNTRVYLGRDWGKRNDAVQIRELTTPATPECGGSGFFVVMDPELPPPRIRTRRDDALSEVRKTLARLERK